MQNANCLVSLPIKGVMLMLSNEKNYVVYHLHTELSLQDSATNYRDYIDKAVSLGQKAIAFTEHG